MIIFPNNNEFPQKKKDQNTNLMIDTEINSRYLSDFIPDNLRFSNE